MCKLIPGQEGIPGKKDFAPPNIYNRNKYSQVGSHRQPEDIVNRGRSVVICLNVLVTVTLDEGASD